MAESDQKRMRAVLQRNTETAERHKRLIREALEKTCPGTLQWLDAMKQRFPGARLIGLDCGGKSAQEITDAKQD